MIHVQYGAMQEKLFDTFEEVIDFIEKEFTVASKDEYGHDEQRVPLFKNVYSTDPQVPLRDALVVMKSLLDEGKRSRVVSSALVVNRDGSPHLDETGKQMTCIHDIADIQLLDAYQAKELELERLMQETVDRLSKRTGIRVDAVLPQKVIRGRLKGDADGAT